MDKKKLLLHNIMIQLHILSHISALYGGKVWCYGVAYYSNHIEAIYETELNTIKEISEKTPVGSSCNASLVRGSFMCRLDSPDNF